MEYSALLILHATLRILMLTECIAFLMPGSFIAAKAIRNPHLLYNMDFLIFRDWKNSHLATIVCDQHIFQQLQSDHVVLMYFM